MKHPHAELMAQYAQDALETDTPWERWEVRQVAKGCEPSDWRPCMPRDMLFPCDFEYRRKPKAQGVYSYKHYYTLLLDNVPSADRVESILEASHISVYSVDKNGVEQWVYDIPLPAGLIQLFKSVGESSISLEALK